MKVLQRGQRPAIPLVIALIAVPVLALTGCHKGSEGTGNVVEGTVTLKGTPLQGGQVHLYQHGELTYVAAPIEDNGHYGFTNLAEGAVKITIQPPGPSSSGGKAPPSQIPVRYTDPERSGLTYTVTKGKQEHNIDLQP
jgi:hypothetical protein